MSLRLSYVGGAVFAALFLLAGCTTQGRGVSAQPSEAAGDRPAEGAPAVAPAVAAAAEPFGRAEPSAPPLAPLPTADVRALGMAELQRGLELARGGNVAGAGQAFDRGGEILPPLRDWTHLLAADAAARAADTATVRRRLAAVEPSLAEEWGWRIRESARRAAGDVTGAIRGIEESAARIGDPVRRAEAWRAAGDLRAERGEMGGALAAYRRAMEAAPQSRAALEVARTLGTFAQLTPYDRLLVGRVWVRHGNGERGGANLDAYLASGEGTPAERAQIRLEAGRAFFRARRYADAERHLVAAARDAASPPAAAAEATFLAARSQYRQGRTDMARTTFLATAERFPREKAAAEALFLLGEIEHDAGRLGAARAYYRRAALTGADVAEAALAAMRLAGIAFAARDFRTAAASLEEYLSSRPEERGTAQARYWAGRARLAAGEAEVGRRHLEIARRVEPVSFYGMRAAELLGGSLQDLPLAPPPRIDTRTMAEVEHALFRVDALRDLELRDASTLELDRTRARMTEQPTALYLIAEALVDGRAPVQGMLLGREIQRREGAWNDRLLRIVYPFRYRTLIEAEARRRGLDPFMVAGLIRQESMFNPIAVSPAGAVGLMQVMPATGQMLARRAGIASFNAAMLRQPEINVQLGTLFLADLQGRYRGNLTEMFAAYNAGPGRVTRWRSLPEAWDEELFAERIPFAETREYVKIVRFNAQLYRMLYGGQAVGK